VHTVTGHEVLEVTGGRPLAGTVAVPGDKSISHRALLLAALADGTSTITGLSGGDDVNRTAVAVAALGATVTRADGTVTVSGGRNRLAAPADTVDLGNSGTGLRLLTGVVATVQGVTRITGDASLRTRPMDRVAEPLALMGARVDGVGERCTPPIAVTGGVLTGIDYTPPMASAQVKSAILLAGINASGDTVVREPIATRAHTEEMLALAGADVTVTASGAGRVVRVRASALRPRDWSVPGDPSQAAFWAVAGLVVPDSRIRVDHVHLGPERIGFVHVLVRMGGDLSIAGTGTGTGDMTASHSALRATTVEAAEIPSLDEVPVLAVAAMVAEGATRFRDVGELRVKESDRLEGTVRLIRAFGGGAHVESDDLVVHGGVVPTPGRVDAAGDHRMAMAAAVAAAACPGGGPSVITGWEAVATSYPGFADTLERLAGRAA
jgi:3-phosphoshikimate 1-carboxyvinyltransferase